MTNIPERDRLHALLIGVDCYLPNRLPDGGYYPSLRGCVRDVNQIESFLTGRLGLPGDRIIKLTATNNESVEPPESREQWPTYQNMVDAFMELIRRASPGDEVYIHYSGHGGRTPTIFPELKGANALDESLVPTDIGTQGTRYLRDVEIGYLVRQMVDKGLVVTMVLDSCHSGGATRGKGGGAVRGISSVDTTDRPRDSLVATPEELALNWRATPAAQTKSAQLSSGWLPALRDTVILAACRANELANEFAFDGKERNGALTYWLLDSLNQIGPGLTFGMIHDRIMAKVHTTFPQQTPQLQGDGARVLFNVTRVPRLPSVRVLEVDAPNRRVRLEAGKTQGLTVGAEFAIYPAEATDVTGPAGRLALSEVAEVQDAESWANLDAAADPAGIEAGAQAVPAGAGAVNLRSRIRLVRQALLPERIDQTAALERLADEIKKSGWLASAEEDESADFQVAVNANGEYEVWDPSGQRVSNLRPALKCDHADSAAAMARRLVHLTKYRNVKLIENTAAVNTLARQFTVELLGSEVDNAPGGVPVMYIGEKATLRLRNDSNSDLNITILDLQPDWGVTQVYPPDKDYEVLSPQTSLEMPLNFELPEGYKEGFDTIKVFATVTPSSFRWLELPILDRPPVTRSAQVGTKAATDPLAQLMQAFGADEPTKNVRQIKLSVVPVTTWTSSQVDVRVRRPIEAPRHVRDPRLSLLQAAFDEVDAEEQAAQSQSKGAATTRAATTRASIHDPLLDAVIEAFINPPALPPPPPVATKGPVDTAKYCANMTAGMAKELWNKLRGRGEKYEAYKAALTAKFGDCDPRYGKALAKYAEYLAHGSEVPYKRWEQLSDFVVDGELKADAVLGVVADWGTGQPEALEVLRQVKAHDPQVVVHLGDVYYAGTAFEMENYFYLPWMQVLQPEMSGVRSFALPGNHDYYAGGLPFFELLKKIGQPSSYFCYRNDDWQLIGLDTALNDRLGGPPTALDDAEAEWLRDKIENAGTRRTILLSHHQLFSTNDEWDGRSFNENLYKQVAGLLPKLDLWLWGHEHDLVVFGPHKGLERGRCVGGSAFPVGKYEMPELPKNPEVPYNKQVTLSKGTAFYQHCYAVIKLHGRRAEVGYYEDGGGRLLFSETV